MRTIPIRGVSLFVEVIGQGYPLLLMHGGPGADHSTLLTFRPCADRFTLIFYDHRCNGRSEGAAVSSMTWENLTADAEALRQTLGATLWPANRREHERHVAAVCAQLDEATFARAWAEGRVLTMEEAIELATSDVT